MTFNALKFTNCELLLDPTDASFLTKDGSNNVSAMTDLSGNSRSGSSTDEPLWNSSAINGIAAIEYDGTSEFMEVSSLNSILSRFSDFTVCIVFKLDVDDATPKTILASSVSSSDRFTIQRASSQKLSVGIYDGSSYEIATVDFTDTSSAHIVTVTNSSSEGLKAYLDGVPLTGTSGAPTTGATARAILGRRVDDTSFWDGLIGDVVVYSEVLSKSDRQELEFGFGEKWGVHTPVVLKAGAQSLSGNRLVKLYEIDATNQGGSLMRFCSAVDTSIEVDTITYSSTTAIGLTLTPHTLDVLDNINISGVTNETDYNGDVTVTSVGDQYYGLRPLDLYPDNAVLAFAFEKLRSAYTGYACKIRRDSDDEELDIGFLSNGDFDINSLNAFLSGANGYITTWYDQTSNALHAYQTDPTDQPLLDVSGIDNHPCASIDSADTAYFTTTGLYEMGPGGLTFFSKFTNGNSYPIGGSDVDVLVHHSSFNVSTANGFIDTSEPQWRQESLTGSTYRLDGVTQAGNNTPLTTDQTYQGTIIATSNSPASESNFGVLGHRSSGAFGSYEGKVSHIILYDIDMDSSDYQAVEDYIQDYRDNNTLDPKYFSYTMSGTPSADASGSEITLTRLNDKMVFDGNDYTPIAFEAEGFEFSGQGSLPTPKIRVSNVGKVLAAAVIALNDLVGAKFTRIRTFRKHLDDGSDPDVAAIFPKEIYNINRKSVHNKILLEFELASPMDQEGVKIPGRQCIKRVCTHKYRVWNGSSFDYSEATCPYAGVSYFDETDSSTTAANDQCSKQLSSCKLRFGNAALPTRAFPGVGGTT